MTNYDELNLISSTFFDNDLYEITTLSNAAALINQYMSDISWVGFYLFEDNKLILGPFQGRVACTEIDLGKGVCGTCAKLRDVVIVKDVHQFEGHIACDSRSNSEIVLPIIINDKLYGVLDIDSTSFDRFKENDKLELLKFIDNLSKVLIKYLK